MLWEEAAGAPCVLSYRRRVVTPPASSLHLSLLLSVVGRVGQVWLRNPRCCLMLFFSVVATFIPSCLVIACCLTRLGIMRD